VLGRVEACETSEASWRGAGEDADSSRATREIGGVDACTAETRSAKDEESVGDVMRSSLKTRKRMVVSA